MRGCLTILLLGAAFLVGVVWFGGPPLAATVVEATLTSSGFQADELDVTVAADPPLRLAVGRADRISLEASGVRWRGLRARSMSLALDGVDIAGRTASTAAGRFEGVALAGTSAGLLLGDIDVRGPADAALTTVRLPNESVNALAIAAFERELGVRPEAATLIAPDGLLLQAGGQAITGRFEIDATGALIVASTLGTIRLVEQEPSVPLRLTGATVTGAGLELTGTIDLASLLR